MKKIDKEEFEKMLVMYKIGRITEREFFILYREHFRQS